TIELVAGQMCLTEMNVVGAVDLNESGGFTTTRFPRSLLLQGAPSAQTQIAPAPGHDRAPRLMIERYAARCTGNGGGRAHIRQKAAAQHLADLVGHVIGTSADGKDLVWHRGVTAARLNLLKAHIVGHLESADLTLQTVARTNGLSERQVQRLFAAAGTTFSDF